MVTSYIALGSNLGDRSLNINLALEYLRQDPAIKILKISSLIETEPLGGPPAWLNSGWAGPPHSKFFVVTACNLERGTPQAKFLNGAAKLKTNYSAQELLKKLQETEVKLGREKLRPKNQPRTIDLDILLYGDSKIDEESLKIPHPRMWEREFVTRPLREIAPELFK